ncbi:MAG: hypothetical protein HZB44_02890 [Actinobacteria bacterium]|nr:hypothetical protein [Actinomycetota bacterium]
MKASWKLGLVAIMTMSLALILILGATIGSAAAPNPALSNDLLLIGNGGAGANNIKVVDVDAMATVNTIAGGTSLANNHGTIVDSTGRYLYNTNNALVGTGATAKTRVTKFDLGTLTEVGVMDGASADGYALGSGACGIEWNLNDSSTGKLWVTSMSASTTNGGLYEVDQTTGFTGRFVDNTAGADNGATCGIGWNASGSLAYGAAMNAKKTTEITNLSSGTPALGASAVSATVLHMMTTDKVNGLAYVAAGKDAANNGFIDVVDLSTMTVVNHMLTGNPSQPHDVEISADGGFLYSHSRFGGPGGTTGNAGLLLIYDIGNGMAGGTRLAPVLVGSIADEGTATTSCGTEVLVKSSYCGSPALSLSKTSVLWASYADYTAGLLTVNYSVGNSGINANTVQIVGSTSTNGVLLATATPVAVGNIATGGSAAVTLQYNVPGSVASFSTTTYATAKDLCNNTYAYPGAMP